MELVFLLPKLFSSSQCPAVYLRIHTSYCPEGVSKILCRHPDLYSTRPSRAFPFKLPPYGLPHVERTIADFQPVSDTRVNILRFGYLGWEPLHDLKQNVAQPEKSRTSPCGQWVIVGPKQASNNLLILFSHNRPPIIGLFCRLVMKQFVIPRASRLRLILRECFPKLHHTSS